MYTNFIFSVDTYINHSFSIVSLNNLRKIIWNLIMRESATILRQHPPIHCGGWEYIIEASCGWKPETIIGSSTQHRRSGRWMYSLRLREMVVNAWRVPAGRSNPCHPAPPRHQRVGHYLATAVTTAQRLMHAIVAASRPELPCFRRDRRQMHSYGCRRMHPYI